MGEFDDLIPEFITESTELLETVEGGLLQLESGQVEEDTVHTIFRAIHSIKGGAGFVGLTKIERLAHRMEDVLNLIRNGDLQPNQTITDALLQSLDVLTALFERIDEHEDIDVDGPIRALDAALSSNLDDEVKADVASTSTPQAHTGLPAFDVNEYTIKNKLQQGNLFYIHLDLNQIESRGLTPMQLVNEMLSMGEILDSVVELAEAGDSETYEVQHVTFHVLYFTVLEGDLLSAAMRLEEDEFRLLSADDFQLSGSGAKKDEAPEEAPQPEPQAPPQPEPTPQPAASEPATPAAPEAAPAPVAENPPVPAPPPAQPPQVQAVEEEPPSARSGEYLTFMLGNEHYGVDILSVQEIIGVPSLTKLPRSPAHVLGVMNMRGMVVPVIDLRIKLGLPVDENKEPVVVVLRVGNKVIGAVVDGVSDVVQIDEDQIQDPPDFVGAVSKEDLRGLSLHDSEMLILLELDRILAMELSSNVA